MRSLRAGKCRYTVVRPSPERSAIVAMLAFGSSGRIASAASMTASRLRRASFIA